MYVMQLTGYQTIEDVKKSMSPPIFKFNRLKFSRLAEFFAQKKLKLAKVSASIKLMFVDGRI